MSNYFNNTLANDVWTSKYQHNNETIEEFFKRISDEFIRLNPLNGCDQNKLSDIGKRVANKSDELIRDLFKALTIIPGGSVLSGIGTNKPVSLSNCFVLKTEDSIESIFDTARNMSQIYKRRGGVGTDLSHIRPRTAVVNNAAKTTGGVVPFMELFSQVTNTIGQDGRRGALMLSIDINHPDSPEFITCKQDLTKVTGANISVKLNDEFKKAVENDEDYILRWPINWNTLDAVAYKDKEYNKLYQIVNFDTNETTAYYKKVKAKELWESIVHCAWNTAEPGILFWSSILDNDPASVYPEFEAISTNPCGEIPLSPFDSCRLIATNLLNLVNNPFTEDAIINKHEAEEVFYIAQVIADILVDLEVEAVDRILTKIQSKYTPETRYLLVNESGEEYKLWLKIREIGANGRRTGTGLLGLADMLAALDSDYNNLDVIEGIMNLKFSSELNASIDLAIIKGSFPAYKSELEYQPIEGQDDLIGTNDFYKFLAFEFPEEYQRMLEYGRRNISWSTIAPTGTISILSGTTSGCEPLFAPYYIRKRKCNPGETPTFIDKEGVGFIEYNVLHPTFEMWWKIYSQANTLAGVNLETASKEELDNIFKMSPWYSNIADQISPKDRVKVQGILQKYTTHSISSTVNVGRETTEETINQIYMDAWNNNLKGITVYRDGSRDGILTKTPTQTSKEITERPTELDCKVFQFKNEKKDWIAFVGVLNDRPHEIFTGPKDLDVFPIPSTVTEGLIIKVKECDEPSRYDFRYIDSYGYVNTLGGLSRVYDKEFWNYARLVSGLLQSGISTDKVIKVIESLSFTNKSLNNWKSGTIRALKHFVEDGTEVHGEKCPNCGKETIVYEGGCKICKTCGESHCG